MRRAYSPDPNLAVIAVTPTGAGLAAYRSEQDTARAMSQENAREWAPLLCLEAGHTSVATLC